MVDPAIVPPEVDVSIGVLLLLALLGAAVGIFGTLVGAGGGFILTPVLLVLYPRTSPSTITAISLVVVFFNAASGSIAYARQRRIDYASGLAYALATMPGAIVGVLVVGFAPRRVFDALTGVILAAAGASLMFGRRLVSRNPSRIGGTPRTITDRSGTIYRYRVNLSLGVLYSLAVGFVSSFLGIGGGIIHVPLMVTALGFPVHIATATSHFVLANMAAAGSVTHIATGAFSAGTGIHRALSLSVGVIGGAQVGAWMSQRIHGTTIQRLLSLALAVLAARLLIGAA
ncbi:MAG: sulfite exporter TauE/SafE family protein [Candidatus Dormiibacterota bacterium]